MKTTLAIAITAAAVALAGCGLLNTKGSDDQSGTDAGGAAAGIDPAVISVSDQLPGVKVDQLQQGYSVEQQTEAAGQTYPTRYRVVGETDAAWQIEHYGPVLAFQPAADKAEYILGLTVDKQSGKVTKAVLGKAGEEGAPITINAMPAVPAAGEAPAGTDTEVSIALGTFPAHEVEMGGTTSWTGTQGELKGVLLKQESAAGSKELKELPSTATIAAGETQVDVTKLIYTDGTEVWLTPNEVVAAFFPRGEGMGAFKSITTGATLTVTEVGSDAQPQLKW